MELSRILGALSTPASKEAFKAFLMCLSGYILPPRAAGTVKQNNIHSFERYAERLLCARYCTRVCEFLIDLNLQASST